jgi:signal transduction histidine kinase
MPRPQEESVEALRREAGAFAHEINNLLQPILIYAASGAAEAPAHDKLRRSFERIAQAAGRAGIVARNALFFARPPDLALEDVEVAAVVRETVAALGAAVAGPAMVEVVAESGVVRARAERTWLAHVVANLLANAGDALPAGGRIVVRVGHVERTGEADPATGLAAGLAPGRCCRISVEDPGPSLSVAQLAGAFDRFPAAHPHGRGAGLGLAVVAVLARGWGGDAVAESVAGGGSRLSVLLPVP